MNPVAVLARRVGAGNVARTLLALALLTSGSLGFAAFGAPPEGVSRLLGFDEAVASGGVLDTDGDGLADAAENLLGSDPHDFDTLGNDVPDGWLDLWFRPVDWSDPGLLAAPVLVAPEEALPAALRSPGALPWPTVAELFGFLDEAHGDPVWWATDAGPDPRAWDGDGDGVADAWMLANGLPLGEGAADAPAPGDSTLTARQKYDLGLDPQRSDTDRDGLADVEELDGAATFATLRVQFKPTDPLRYASRGDGIADGYLARYGQPTDDVNAGLRTPAGDNLTVTQAFMASLVACGGDAANCTLRPLLDGGRLLDPRQRDANADGIPNEWILAQDLGLAALWADGRNVTFDSSAAWDAAPWNGQPGNLSGLRIDAVNPAPATPRIVTLHDAYAHLRPAGWDEARDGTWWGGLGASTPNGTPLPAAVAMRGWNLSVDLGLGGLPVARVQSATADPRSGDSDGDGLPDRLEYFGITVDGQTTNRTDAANPDTDSDGLTDAQESGPAGIGTDPLRRDTAGNFLSDGEKASYWTARHAAARALFEQDAAEAMRQYGWLVRGNESLATAIERLRPTGSIRNAEPNVLAADADGDGLRDGAELFPNRYLDPPLRNPRPATDPARADTDGDSLPDSWEIVWSRDRYYRCAGGCSSPVPVAGWPLDPSLRNSLGTSTSLDDRDNNLAGSTLRIAPNTHRPFNNSLAYRYGLNPYSNDTAGEGLGALFAVHWGIEHVPDEVVEAMRSDRTRFAWAWANAEVVNAGLRSRNQTQLSDRPVAMDPARPGTVTLSTNLLGLVTGREKGTWTFTSGTCQATVLPASGARRESSVAGLQARSGLAGCWAWRGWTIQDDVQSRLNPWSHDFDADGLPDAWEVAYASDPATPNGAAALASAVAAGCSDPLRTSGLPPAATHCPTMAVAYARGLDPRSQDTDGGGLADWFEVALGRDPLDDLDDYGEEDWDGDGIQNRVEDAAGTNRLLPDTDRDGLLDGGSLAFTHGDHCLPTSGVTPVPGTEHRPGGALDRRGLHDLFAQAGVARVVGGLNGCPAGQVRFLAEGVFDPDTGETLGSGLGSDPTRWDTSGDGQPDGWAAYWRRGLSDAQRLDLSPTSPTGTGNDPDGDLVDNDLEYEQGRPAAWSTPRDGPWWGGLDPSRSDTDADAVWHVRASDADDVADLDLDNDGLLGSDPDLLDPLNRGVAGWAADGTLRTNTTLLWPAIEGRTTSHLVDRDLDFVPDFLDRADVRIANLSLSTPALSKDTTFHVLGRVQVDEPAGTAGLVLANGSTAPDGAAVQGVTVVVYATDAAGRVEPIGYGFTGADGRFNVTAGFGSGLAGPTRALGGLVMGRSATLTAPPLPTGAAALLPGPVRVHVAVEGNDEGFQPLSFHAGGTSFTHALAYRSTAEPLPGGRLLRSVALDSARSGPREGAASVAFAAAQVADEASDGIDAVLQASAVLAVAPPAGLTPWGSPVTVTGTLADDRHMALGGRTVSARLQHNGTASPAVSTLTDAQGRFSLELATTSSPPGTVTVNVTATLMASDTFLLAPAPVVRPLHLSLDTHWSDIMVAGIAVDAGELVAFDGGTPVVASATLRDHLGRPVPARPLTLSLRTLAGTLQSVAATTDAAGRAEMAFASLDALRPLEELEVRLAANTSAGDAHTPASVFLLPQYAVTLQAPAEVTVQAAAGGPLAGRLLQGGAPVQDATATVRLECDDGLASQAVGSNTTGSFSIAVPAASWGERDCNLRFVGSDFLRPANMTVRLRHLVERQLLLAAGPTTWPGATEASGLLFTRALEPMAGPVELWWADRPATVVVANASADGIYHALLDVREPGAYRLHARAPAAGFGLPANGSVEVLVRMPNALQLDVRDLFFAATGARAASPGNGTLRDAAGAPVASAPVRLSFVDGEDGRPIQLNVTTDAAGRLTLPPILPPQPGNWTVRADFGGDNLGLPATASATFHVAFGVELAVDRFPAGARGGTRVVLAGTAQLPIAHPGQLPLDVRLDGQSVGAAALDLATGRWSASLQMPNLTTGASYHLSIEGVPSADHVVANATAQVAALHDAVLTVEHDGAPGGRLALSLLDARSRAPIANATVVLVVTARDGSNTSLEVKTDERGQAVARLESAGGRVSLATVRGGDVLIDSVELTRLVAPLPSTSDASRLPWIAAGATVLVGIAACYTAWLLRGRAAVRRGLREAYDALRDPKASPAAGVRAAYQRLVRALTNAGHVVRPEHTVREVAEAALRAFRLPKEPMTQLSRVFERAVYSDGPVGAYDRQAALKALLALLPGVARARRGPP